MKINIKNVCLNDLAQDLDNDHVTFSIEGSDIKFLEWVDQDGTVSRIDSHLEIHQLADVARALGVDEYDLDLNDVYDALDNELNENYALHLDPSGGGLMECLY